MGQEDSPSCPLDSKALVSTSDGGAPLACLWIEGPQESTKNLTSPVLRSQWQTRGSELFPESSPQTTRDGTCPYSQKPRGSYTVVKHQQTILGQAREDRLELWLSGERAWGP